MAPKGGLDATWALETGQFLLPAPFYANFGGSDPFGAFAPYPACQKGSKKAQKGQKWLKMTN